MSKSGMKIYIHKNTLIGRLCQVIKQRPTYKYPSAIIWLREKVPNLCHSVLLLVNIYIIIIIMYDDDLVM